MQFPLKGKESLSAMQLARSERSSEGSMMSAMLVYDFREGSLTPSLVFCCSPSCQTVEFIANTA